MRIKSLKILIIPVSLILVLLLVCARNGSNNDDQRRNLLLDLVSFALQTGHYSPVNMNDDFSSKAYNLYLERIDFNKRFLIAEDIKDLKKYEFKIDDAAKQKDWTFFDLSYKLIRKRIGEVRDIYTDILAKPFEFTADEYIELDEKKIDYAADLNSLKERWRLSMKYETLTRLEEMLKDQDKRKEKSDTVKIKTFTELEADARGKVKKRYDEYFHRLDQLNEDDYLDLYINSIVNINDPHTEYFPAKEKDNFDIQMSGQLEGIGAQLTQKDEYVEVLNVIPGGPAWKLGQPEVGDKILKVAQGSKEWVDIVDMRLDDAVKLIRGKKGTKVRLSVKKVDGTINQIELTRDIVILEETFAKSAVIYDPEVKGNIGYIKLPSFYLNLDNRDGRRSADDVKKEIEKLKKENIRGLVFDLRNNGGGSLDDVVSIAGYFIKEGPVVQVVGKQSQKRILRDPDPGVLYDGPLVVMVNQVSASASEIFAAAIQDYNRGIVIGGTSSYGKGTVQNFLELDKMVSQKPEGVEPLGSLKMTIQKFYRVNGGTTQLKGVTPDIILPDYFNYVEIGEKELEYPLPWDEYNPAVYEKWVPPYDVKDIITDAKSRIKSDTNFIKIDENGKRMEKIQDETNITLNYEKYHKMNESRTAESKKYERIGKDTLNIVLKFLKADIPDIEADTSRKARSDAWLLNLKKDIYLREAVNVVEVISRKSPGSIEIGKSGIK